MALQAPDPERPDTWSAKLVLESQPRWMRHFHLFDAAHDQVERLVELKASQLPPDPLRREPRRSIDVYEGDFNLLVHDLLSSGSIGPSEATFCLLDQRTFECQWATIELSMACGPPASGRRPSPVYQRRAAPRSVDGPAPERNSLGDQRWRVGWNSRPRAGRTGQRAMAAQGSSGDVDTRDPGSMSSSRSHFLPQAVGRPNPELRRAAARCPRVV